jgi:hypothetical protein
MDTSNVRHVFIAGQLRKWNGKLAAVMAGGDNPSCGDTALEAPTP